MWDTHARVYFIYFRQTISYMSGIEDNRVEEEEEEQPPRPVEVEDQNLVETAAVEQGSDADDITGNDNDGERDGGLVGEDEADEEVRWIACWKRDVVALAEMCVPDTVYGRLV